MGPVERASLEMRGRSLYHDVRMQTREPLLGIKRVHRGGLVGHLIAVYLVSQSSTVLVDKYATYYTMMKIWTPSSALRLSRLSNRYRSFPGRRRYSSGEILPGQQLVVLSVTCRLEHSPPVVDVYPLLGHVDRPAEVPEVVPPIHKPLRRDIHPQGSE